MANAPVTDTLIRSRDVRDQTGFGRTSIYLMIRDGTFPRPVRVGGSLRFSQDEVGAWIDGQKARRLTEIVS